jgi:lactoylglutathione lyase
MGARLQNVVVPTRRFELSVAFYRDAIGLEVAVEGDGFCFLRAGNVNIAVHPAGDGGDFAPTGHGLYLDLAVDDLSSTRRRLESSGVAIRREWQDDNGTFLLVADPDGNLLEIYEPAARVGDGM